jgi:hypothetical protein
MPHWRYCDGWGLRLTGLDLLKLVFNGDAQRLRGPVIDDRPLSESEIIRVYAPPLAPNVNGRNYLEWLVDAANTSLDVLRAQTGFIDNKTPTALLYLVLRYAMMQGYWKSSIELRRSATLTQAFDVDAVRSEPPYPRQPKQSGQQKHSRRFMRLCGITSQ